MKITIYTTGYCPYCFAAKRLLESKKLKYEEIDVSNDDAMRQKLVQLTNQETVPQIFIDGKSIGGYTDLVAYFEKSS